MPPAILLAPLFGEFVGSFGVIYAVILSDIVTCMVGLLFVTRYLSATIDYRSGLRSLLSSIICCGVLILFSSSTRFVPALQFTLDAVIFFFLYLTISPLTRSIDLSDVERLRKASHETVLSRVIDFIMKYEEFLISYAGKG